ncbi:MAG: FAD-dependent oxidoreductase [Candidatus Thiodiazotropha sp. (ex Gloverina cf. vestifex)]|nr:FAD-dependent oxidoreductase [Candidatus Thiodiazotropha sp. (ex Gloverina cf. vestifex)]
MGSFSASPVSTQVDVAIFGGGIAGLWLLARLRQAGYSAILLEPNGLGGVQTLASQGIIHGGTKYALTGKLTGSSQAIKAMPGIWRDCLTGEGELDLSRVRMLSDHQFLWSTSGLISRMAGFFAGKVMESRVREVKENDCPAAFRNPGFKGTVYRLDEPVLDVASLVSELSRQFGDSAYTLNWPDGLRFDHARRFSLLGQDGAWQTLETRQTVFTAGAGNEALLKCLGRDKPIMQKRPLQMVMLKGDLPPLYAHCLGASANPRLTVTSYPLACDKTLWYLGGDVAEQGVGRNQEEQIAAAKRELNQLLPWVDLQKVAWGTLNVDRAEPHQSDGGRPESSFVQAHEGLIVAWPTKLAFAPRLAEQVMAELLEADVPPTSESANVSLSIALAQAAILPWEKEHLWT